MISLAALHLLDFSWLSQPDAWIALLTLGMLSLGRKSLDSLPPQRIAWYAVLAMLVAFHALGAVLWLALPEGHALPEGWRPGYGAVTARTVRGGLRGSAIGPDFLDYERRLAAHHRMALAT